MLPPETDHTYCWERSKLPMLNGDLDPEQCVTSTTTQTDLSMQDIEHWEHEIKKLRAENDKLKLKPKIDKKQETRSHFSDTVTKNDASAKYFTGLPSVVILMGLFNIVKNACGDITYWNGSDTPAKKRHNIRARKLSMFEEYLMTMVRIRLGLECKTLSFIFGVHYSTLSKTFTTWINVLYTIVKPTLVWPSRAVVKKHMPRQFRRRYPETRAIIDCTEVFVKKPMNTQAQAKTWSSYKSHNTFKALVAVNPNGAFTFVSSFWSGNVSDRHITKESGFLDLIEAGDEIMADRGFTIRDLLLERKARLNMPPFTRACASRPKGRKLTSNEISKTRQIATLRIHVERAIRVLKNYKILSGNIDLSMKPLLDQILVLCAAFANMQGPLIRDQSVSRAKNTK